ncbi:MAG: Eco29kI family restriction endonuclease [Candidatus Binataceae bacterium]
MAFTRTEFVPLAIPSDGSNRFGIYSFPSRPGIYALYLNKVPLSEVLAIRQRSKELTTEALSRLEFGLVYVGKTSGNGTLRQRLRTHFNKLQSRENISVDRIICRYLEIEHDWNVLFAEHHLIEATEITETPPPPWNTNGFGSNTPGRGRPGFRQKSASHFDVLYPLKPGPR